MRVFMTQKNIFFAHSGGVTPVVNTIASAVIQTAQKHGMGKVLAGQNGILGLINESLYDMSHESKEIIQGLTHTPASAFGSCRVKLDCNDTRTMQRIFDVLKAHNIGYFLYNGGNDSQDTTSKIAQVSKQMGYPLQCIGIPKTVDNDLACTDCCPGFGSVAKYVAVSTKEASLDVASMSATSTKVFILEVMGRHAGWITAAAGLASEHTSEGPHILLFPEVAFNQEHFTKAVKHCVQTYGHCVVVTSEGLCDQQGTFLTASNNTDAFGHTQLGGVAPMLANLVTQTMGYKTHSAVADYLQRSARHIASQTDVDHAFALGKAAVEALLQSRTDIMMTIQRLSNTPYSWKIGYSALSDVANIEKKLPEDFISQNQMHITQACRDYLSPLIQGEAYPPYRDNGLPHYVNLANPVIPTILSPFK